MFSVYLLTAVVDKDPLGTDHLSDSSSPAYCDYSIPFGVDGVGESSSANVALIVDPGFGVTMTNAAWLLVSW